MPTLTHSPHIAISRTDSLGDVILTLPLAGLLKQKYPQSKITFVCRSYTKPLVEACTFVDEILDLDILLAQPKPEEFLKNLNIDTLVHVFPNKELALLAKKSKIPQRIGTNRRWFHWFTCNNLVNLSRQKSLLHEAQLNVGLLKPLGIEIPTLAELSKFYGLKPLAPLPEVIINQLQKEKPLLILHPKSKGSAREWPAAHFVKLIDALHNHFQIVCTGLPNEKDFIEENIISKTPHTVLNFAGQLTLPQLMTLINHAQALVAASTGPLHIAAALGKRALGLYPPLFSMLPRRWGALGENTTCLVAPTATGQPLCATQGCSTNLPCACMARLMPKNVADSLLDKS